MVKKNYKENKDNVSCKICFKEFKYLGSHLKEHKITAREYKIKFGLDYNLPLMNEETRIKKQKAFNKDREKYLKNFEKGDKYRFKKGKCNRKYFSKQNIKEVTERILKNDNKGICPICNLRFKHLNSHLYNKHRMVKVK